MTPDDISSDQVAAITEFVDIEAPPPEGRPTAFIIFGTNQPEPGKIAAAKYLRGAVPLIIATGGTNRHNGINEAREFRAILAGRGVPDAAIRIEDKSANTWQNVEFSLPFLREALNSGLTVTAVCKWYHRRAVHILKTLIPDIGPMHVITWEPIYTGKAVTRGDWPLIPDGKRRVIREWEEVSRRVSDGSFAAATRAGGTWRLPASFAPQGPVRVHEGRLYLDPEGFSMGGTFMLNPLESPQTGDWVCRQAAAEGLPALAAMLAGTQVTPSAPAA